MYRNISILSIVAFFILSGCNYNNTHQQIDDADNIIVDSLGITMDSLRKRAIHFTETDQLIEAMTDINAVIESEGLTIDNSLALAEVYLRMGKVDQAQRTLINVLDINKNSAQLLSAVARVYLVKENYELCHQYAANAFRADPSFAMPVFIDGLAYLEDGDTMAAINCFSNVVLVDPENYDAMIQLGLLYSGLNDPLALQYLTAADKVKPDGTEALHLIGLFYQQNGYFREALDSYKKILDVFPDYVHAQYNSGYIHLVYLAHYDSAEMFFQKAIDIAPNYVDAIYNLGYAFELDGDRVRAREKYNQVLKLLPEYTLASEALERLDR